MGLFGIKLDVVIDFPAIVLIVLLFLGVYVIWRTQQAVNNFDFSDMLRDENGKPSSARMGVFVCLAGSTWGFMYMLITNKGIIDTWIFVSYIGIWSGAKVAERAIDTYINRQIAPPASIVPAPPAVSVTQTTRKVKMTVPKDADDDDTPAH